MAWWALVEAWNDALHRAAARNWGHRWPGMIMICEATTHAPWPMTLHEAVEVAASGPFTRWDRAAGSLDVLRWEGWPPVPIPHPEVHV